MFTVSPNRQYLGIFNPTTPATHGPINIKNIISYGKIYWQLYRKATVHKVTNVEHTNMNADSEVDFFFGSVSDFETFDHSQ